MSKTATLLENVAEFDQGLVQNHRIASLGMDILRPSSPNPAAQAWSARAVCPGLCWVLKVSSYGDSTTSRGSLVLYLTTLTVKRAFSHGISSF